MALSRITEAVASFTDLTIGDDLTLTDDLLLASDAALIKFGADADVIFTHVADTGLLLNSASVIQFRDSAINIGSPADGDLDINADDEIELNSTLIDVNGNLDVSGTIVGASTLSATTITASTAFVPDASDGAALGTTALEFSDLFLADAAVIALGADQDVTLTHVADTGVLLNAASVVQFRDSAINIGSPADGDLDINADDEIELNSTLIDVNGNLDVSGTIVGASTLSATTITASTAFVPDASDGAALGTTALEFSDLFLADAAVINLGADQDVTITHVADTGVLINGASVVQFRDSAINIGSPADGDLDINADDEIELNSTLIDINGNVEISGTAAIVGIATFTDDIIIGDGKTIGSASDVDAITIGSDGDITLTQDLELQHDGAILSFGANDEIALTHVHDTGLLLTDSGGTPTLQLHNASESVSSDGSKLILTSNGVAFSLPTADGSANQVLATDGSGTLSFATSSANTPSSADGQALGSASLEWSDLFLADGSVINLGADQDVKITHVADTGVLLNAASVIQFRDSAINIGSPADGDLDINADDEIELNSTLIDVNGNLDVSGTIVGASTLSATTGTFSGVLKTDDATDATSTTDGSLQTDGGLSVAKDAVIGDDLFLLSDSAVLNIGADSDLKITHDGTNGDFESAGNLVFDVAGDITLDAAGSDINFAAAGTTFGFIKNDGDNFIIGGAVSDGDIIFQGNDGGSLTTFLQHEPGVNAGITAFHPNGTSMNPVGMTLSDQSTGPTLSFNHTSGSAYEFLTFRQSGGQKGAIVTSANATAYQTSSDYRLKQNVDYDWDGTTECKKLKPCQFKWISDVAIEDGGGDAAEITTGFLAHEVQTVVPEAVTGVKDATNDDDSIKPQGIDQSKIMSILTKTVLELEARITALE